MFSSSVCADGWLKVCRDENNCAYVGVACVDHDAIELGNPLLSEAQG